MKRGFSLLEVSIAMAIAGVVAAVATQASVLILKSVKHEGKRSSVDQDARRLVDFVVSNAQAAGGGPVRPWMALAHEESCGARHGLPACTANNDRLTLVDVDTARSTCAIVSASASAVVVDHAAAPDDALCCFDWASGQTPSDGSTNQIDGKAVMLVDGDHWISRVVSTAGVDGSGNCVVNFNASLTHLGANTSTLLGGNNRPFLSGGSIDHASMAGGTLVIVRPRTLFVDGGRLMEWNDDLVGLSGANPNDAVAQAAEMRVVFPGVFQLQLARGYDGLPEDGRAVDVGTTSDEWVGTVASDTRPGTLRDDQLRLLRVGVVVGVKTTTPISSSVKVLNGAPVVTGPTNRMIVRAAQGEAFLRNLLLFY